MAEPARRGLRAARRSGLTSPDPVRTPTAPTATPNPAPEPRNPGQAAQQASGRTPAPGFTPENSSWQESDRKRPTGIGRWIEAKPLNAQLAQPPGPSASPTKIPQVRVPDPPPQVSHGQDGTPRHTPALLVK